LRPTAALEFFDELRASKRLMYPGDPQSTLKGNSPSVTNACAGFCHLKRFKGQFTPDSLADVTITALPRLEKFGIICRIGDDGDALVVLCCCSRSERVEIADNDGDGGGGLGFEILFIGRYGSGQDTLDIYFD